MLHVVQVEHGRVVSLSPFNSECQSMMLVDAILLSDSETPSVEHLFSENNTPELHLDKLPLYAFRMEQAGDFISLEKLG